MKNTKPYLSPSVTMSHIFGSDFILNPRPSFSNYGWLPESQKKLDFLTGSPLVVTGDMPVICSQSVVTKNVISLLSMANLEIAPLRHTYNTESDYLHIINSIGDQKKKLVVNHLHPSGEIKRKYYWINPKTLSFLNNKANLDKLVPKGHFPKRIVVQPKELTNFAAKVNFPCVVKAGTEKSTGGGYGIFICKEPNDVHNTYHNVQTCKTVVIEEYLEIEKNYCVQFAITSTGQIIYLGTSEQLTDSSGYYYGNWITRNQVHPNIAKELAYEIMQKAHQMGYTGIGGVDVVSTKDNRVLVLDLNFRLNGSTPALLLKDSIFKTSKASVFLFRNWKTQLNWSRFMSICSKITKSSDLIPLSLYDPLSGVYPDNNYYLTGVLTGASKDDILKKELALAQQGLR